MLEFDQYKATRPLAIIARPISDAFHRDFIMILCVGTSGCGKSVLLRHLQVHNAVSEGVGADSEEEGASLRSTIPTVGTNLANLSRSRTKKNQEFVANLMGHEA